ncbi:MULTISPECIES: hypothetical protein [Dyella]|uniref:Uncharacterized protein n=2 Tax=Dyella TaxID=231454 RepID=A0A4R0Z162_9GAMM|nr:MULTISPECIES: hypothetical protein [Dyella]TBR39274.1 hypothetical protein EYV96_03345 [Dyella terrae]TCI13138.1 hypothetical protein EZM97_07520 [Dyella soli]
MTHKAAGFGHCRDLASDIYHELSRIDDEMREVYRQVQRVNFDSEDTFRVAEANAAALLASLHSARVAWLDAQGRVLGQLIARAHQTAQLSPIGGHA